MRLFYSNHIQVSIGNGHRFPMEKYDLLHKRLGKQNLTNSYFLQAAQPATEELILLVYQPDYLQHVMLSLIHI